MGSSHYCECAVLLFIAFHGIAQQAIRENEYRMDWALQLSCGQVAVLRHGICFSYWCNCVHLHKSRFAPEDAYTQHSSLCAYSRHVCASFIPHSPTLFSG